MKRFFGLFVLLFVFVLASCGLKNVFQENVNIEFSIPVARGADGESNGETTGSGEPASYKFFVQLKGQNGKIIRQTQTVNVNSNSTNETVPFSFSNLKPQDYEVFVDVFMKEPSSSDGEAVWMWEYTGTSSIEVIADQDNAVAVTLETPYIAGGVFDIKFSYENNGSIEEKLVKNYAFMGSLNEEKASETFELGAGSSSQKIYVRKRAENSNNKENSNPWCLLKTFDYVLGPDSHFADGFNIVATWYKTSQSEEGTPVSTPENLEIKNNAISFIENIQKVRFVNLQISYNNGADSFSFANSFNPVPVSSQVDEGVTEETHFSETQSGSIEMDKAVIQEGMDEVSYLTFNERNSSGRYISDVSLNDILNGKTLDTGDTVVFIMKLPSSYFGTSLPFQRFYYELQEEDWERISSDTELYAGNGCINCDSYPAKDGSYILVMPLNFVQNPQDFNRVLFFFDKVSGANQNFTESSVKIPVESLEYHIYPASKKAFVFGVGQSYSDANPYRYEFNEQLINSSTNTMYQFEGGETVEITLSGTVSLGEQEFNSSDSDVLQGEIYDNASYASTKGEAWQTYHPISKTQDDMGQTITGNVTSLSIVNGDFPTTGGFKFIEIQTPYFDKQDSVSVEDLPEHNYKFQCITVCTDPSKLLVIEDFGIEITVTD